MGNEQWALGKKRCDMFKLLTGSQLTAHCFRLLAFLILFASSSFAAACVENFFQQFVVSDMGQYIGIAFGFMILTIVVVYITGTITNNPNMLVWYKDELFHLFFSAILLAGFASIAFVSCQFLSGFLDFSLTRFPAVVAEGSCYSGSQTPQSVATCYFGHIEGDARRLVASLLKNSIKYEMDSTYIFSLYNPLTGGFMFPLEAHKRTFGLQLDMLAMSFVMPAMVSITIQKLIINFSVDIVTYLLPAAFFLRILSPTRQMGNLLLGVVLAFYVIIPVMYALMGAMDDVVFNDTDCAAKYSALINDQVNGGCESPISFWRVARLIPQAFFLPNLTVAITITFLAGINKALRVLT